LAGEVGGVDGGGVICLQGSGNSEKAREGEEWEGGLTSAKGGAREGILKEGSAMEGMTFLVDAKRTEFCAKITLHRDSGAGRLTVA